MENKNIIKKNIFDTYFTNFFHFVKLLKINGLKQFIIILCQYYVGKESGWGQGAYLNFSTSAVSAGMMWMAGAGTTRAGGASLSRETLSLSLSLLPPRPLDVTTLSFHIACTQNGLTSPMKVSAPRKRKWKLPSLLKARSQTGKH